jgi:hypothetical protein
MLSVNEPNNQKSGLILGSGGNLQKHRVIPKVLGGNEVDAVLQAIGFAFRRIKFKEVHGIQTIP